MGYRECSTAMKSSAASRTAFTDDLEAIRRKGVRVGHLLGHPVHAGSGRPRAKQGSQSGDGGHRTAHEHFDRSITPVADRAAETECGRIALGPGAEPNALNPPVDTVGTYHFALREILFVFHIVFVSDVVRVHGRRGASRNRSTRMEPRRGGSYGGSRGARRAAGSQGSREGRAGSTTVGNELERKQPAERAKRVSVGRCFT